MRRKLEPLGQAAALSLFAVTTGMVFGLAMWLAMQ
jgi:hypothetical protein